MEVCEPEDLFARRCDQEDVRLHPVPERVCRVSLVHELLPHALWEGLTVSMIPGNPRHTLDLPSVIDASVTDFQG